MTSTACDDVFPLTQHWDRLIAAQTTPAFAWNEVNAPRNCTYNVLSRSWLHAVGYALAEHFPFWFADTWILETYVLAYHQAFPIVEHLKLGGKRGHTRGMRDLEFWFRFIAATRIERIATAQKLSGRYPTDAIIRLLEKNDQEQLRHVPRYEQTFHANHGEPSKRYLIAKARADNWLKANGVTL